MIFEGVFSILGGFLIEFDFLLISELTKINSPNLPFYLPPIAEIGSSSKQS